MRLLNIESLDFAEFRDDNRPPYVAASHRWLSDGEATFKDVRDRHNTIRAVKATRKSRRVQHTSRTSDPNQVAVDRYMLHQQRQRRGAVGGDQLDVRLVPQCRAMPGIPGRRRGGRRNKGLRGEQVVQERLDTTRIVCRRRMKWIRRASLRLSLPVRSATCSTSKTCRHVGMFFGAVLGADIAALRHI